MYENRKREFEETIEPLMLKDKLPKPLINFSKELYSLTGIKDKTIGIFKVLQSKAIVRDNPEIVKTINAMDEVKKGFLGMKVFVFGVDNKQKTSKEIKELATEEFGSYESYLVANAMHQLERNEEALELLNNIDEETLETLTKLSVGFANDLKLDRDNRLLSLRK